MKTFIIILVLSIANFLVVGLSVLELFVTYAAVAPDSIIENLDKLETTEIAVNTSYGAGIEFMREALFLPMAAISIMAMLNLFVALYFLIEKPQQTASPGTNTD